LPWTANGVSGWEQLAAFRMSLSFAARTGYPGLPISDFDSDLSDNSVIVLNDKSTEGAISLDAELERIYEEMRGSVCAYLLYLGVPVDQAQDVTQEVFLRLHQSMRKGEVIENLKAWLLRVAHNLGVRVRSKERFFRTVSPDWEQFQHPARSAEELLLERERNQRVAAGVETLSPQQRNCLYLRSEGLRYREIADVMGISPSSVNEFLRRAIARLMEAANG
jgi:RNA polymerase sigma-70 factor (ECF subfamily)